MEEMLKNPELAKKYEENQKKFQAELARRANGDYSARGASIVIPVAVHFPTGNEADRDCLVALAQSQVDVLNADYTAMNADISNWTAASPFYPGLQPGAANISFCLAVSDHPVGVDPELLEGEPAVTIGYNFANGSGFPELDSNWAGYMNFLIKPLSGGTLGYSPLGGSIENGGAVVMNLSTFGTGSGCPGSGIAPGAPFNLGRTVTHELGHFYNLNHTFADNTCTGDDGITDTPNIDTESYNCPPAGSVNACTPGQYSLTMNYMDYVNDACMYMFTPGQMNVVDAYVSSVLASQIKPGVCDPPTPGFTIAGSDLGTCTDGGMIELAYTQVGGFSETTTFSASGGPAGATIVLNPVSLDSDGTFDMSISGLSGATTGDYTITVTGTSASITDSFDFTVSVLDDICPSVGTTQYQTSTTGVTFNTISNLNTGKPSGYSDYTAMSTDVYTDSSYDLTVNANSDGNYQIITYAWIDWNQNCSFDDPGEQYDLGTSANINNQPTINSPLSITVPSDAVLGNTVMRITTKYTDPGLNQFPTSCENGHDAEVEDYTINVLSSLSIDEKELSNFNIYPNPNNGEFTIKLNSNSGNDIAVDVFDIRGRKIFNNSYSRNNSDFSQSIKLNSVEAGMYLVTVSDGAKKITKKIIVE